MNNTLIYLDDPQALEVMAINHKNNASNKCLRSNTVPYILHLRFLNNYDLAIVNLF